MGKSRKNERSGYDDDDDHGFYESRDYNRDWRDERRERRAKKEAIDEPVEPEWYSPPKRRWN